MTVAHQLIARVARRAGLARLGTRFLMTTVVGVALFGALLLVARLTAWIPDVYDWRALAAVPVLALLLAPLIGRRVDPAEAARLIDARHKTRDLFLTASQLEGAPGAYAPIVAEQADARAVAISAGSVVSFGWPRSATAALLLAALVASGMRWLPQLDPFGDHAVRTRLDVQRRALEVTRKATKARIAALKAKAARAESKEVAKAIKALETRLGELKRDQPPKQNLARLAPSQKRLAQLWRKSSQDRLQQTLSQQSTAQRFGAASLSPQAQKWKKQLRKGNTAGLRRELDVLKKLAKKLAAADTPPDEKKKLAKKLKQGLKQMAQTLQQAQAPQAAKAIRKALEQLAMGEQLPQLSSQAMESIQESLQLSQQEMEQMAQTLRDLEKLEQALKTLQMAKRLVQDGQLGKAKKASLADYEKMYQEQMAKQGQCGHCQGSGQGQGGQPCPSCGGSGQNGQGQGKGSGKRGKGGGAVPEDPTAQTDFETQRSKSAVTAGKMLMKWRTDKREVGPRGQARKNYADAVREVKQGVSEAILKEQVPPGYHAAIKTYFDSLKPQSPAKQPK